MLLGKLEEPVKGRYLLKTPHGIAMIGVPRHSRSWPKVLKGRWISQSVSVPRCVTPTTWEPSRQLSAECEDTKPGCCKREDVNLGTVKLATHNTQGITQVMPCHHYLSRWHRGQKLHQICRDNRRCDHTRYA